MTKNILSIADISTQLRRIVADGDILTI